MKKTAVLILSVLCVVAVTPLRAQGVLRQKAVAVESYPHDPAAYTQGLFFWNGGFYETTGQYGSSSLRRVDLKSGKVLTKKSFASTYFGEGSCVVDGKLYVLTWQNNSVFVYDAATFRFDKVISYPREGWGLAPLPADFTVPGADKAAAGRAVMVASDGSSSLFFLDKDMKTVGSVNVTLAGRTLNMLNELEWIDGRVWANVYTTDYIVVINPSNGRVERLIDCSGLIPKSQRTPDMDVLNGIAQGPDGSIYLTGKNWPKLFKVRIQ